MHGVGFRAALLMRQPARQRAAQGGQRVGFGQEGIHAGVQALLLVALHRVRGQRHDGRPRAAAQRQSADDPGCLVAVHHRHLAVHQHQIEGAVAHQRHSFGAVVGHLPLQAELLQHRLGHALVDRVVFDQQHGAVQLGFRRFGGRALRARSVRRRRQHAADDAEQVGTPDRLVQVTQDARLFARALVGVGVGGAEHHQPCRRQRRLRLDCAGELKAVHARHVHVENRDLERAAGLRRLRHQRERLRPAVDAAHLHVPALQLLLQDVAIGLVVVHHQHAHTVQRAGRAQRGRWGPRHRQAQIDDETRPAARRALDADAPPHQAQQAAADRQAQAGAAVLPRGRAVGLREVFEDPRLRFRCDADATVVDADLDRTIRRGLLAQRHANHHFAVFGELERVADQVGDDLAQPERVAVHGQRRFGWGELSRQFKALDLGRVRKHRHRVFDDFDQVEVDRLQLEVAGLDLGKVEDVVDDAQQVTPRGLHRFGPDPLLRVQPTVDEQFVHAQHAVHGRADLVAHGREEFAFGVARRLGRILRVQQFGGTLRDLVFQVVAVCRQAGVARLDLLQHRVEAARQHVQLGDAAGFGTHAVVGLARDAFGQPVQPFERLQHRRVEAAQQPAARAQRERRGDERRGDLPGGLPVEVFQVDREEQAAAHFLLQQHRLAERDIGQADVQVRRRRAQHRRCVVAFALVAGEQAFVLAVQRADVNVG